MTDGLYGLRTQRPLVEGTALSLFGLTTSQARRYGELAAPLTLGGLFPGLGDQHVSCSRAETELYKSMTIRDASASPDVTAFGRVLGDTVTKLQVDWPLCLALPRTQMELFLNGTLQLDDCFVHSQVNLWFCPRSALLRLVHMYWMNLQGLTATDPLMLLVFNPLKSCFTDGTVKTEPGTDVLYTFNRLWLDHCLTTGNVDHFQLEDLELETGLLFEFQGLTLNGLSALSMEMNCSTLFGYHCRGLCGHVVLTVSQGVMIRMTVKEMTHRTQLGLDATADYAEGTEHESSLSTRLLMKRKWRLPLWM